MFQETDWNDDTEARALSEAIFHRHAPSCVSKQNSQSRTSERALLRTLRVLRAAEERPGAAQPELECGPSREARVSKRKHRSPAAQEVTAGTRQEGLGMEVAAQLRVGREESGQEAGGDGSNGARGTRVGTLTRKQWRNWKKNQRRSKNKFRPLGGGNREQVSIAALPGPREGGGCDKSEGERSQAPLGKVKRQREDGGNEGVRSQAPLGKVKRQREDGGNEGVRSQAPLGKVKRQSGDGGNEGVRSQAPPGKVKRQREDGGNEGVRSQAPLGKVKRQSGDGGNEGVRSQAPPGKVKRQREDGGNEGVRSQAPPGKVKRQREDGGNEGVRSQAPPGKVKRQREDGGNEGVRSQAPLGKVKRQSGDGGSDSTALQSQGVGVKDGSGGAVLRPPPWKVPGGGALEGEQLQGSSPQDRSSTLRDRMQRRLSAARFRLLNQQLYTMSSADAQQLFAQDPSVFHLYHHGYTSQLEQWPENPVQRIIHYIKRRPRSAIVADFGCGDCKIARSVGNRVHSFDLVALNDLVTVCDMAKVPLCDASVDIVVFCLSLMGTNLVEFLMEANRVLRLGGILKIAEVASRFEDIRNFVSVLARLGFKLLSKDTESRYFYMFDFEKSRSPGEGSTLPQLQLKPCLYKKR